MYSRKTYYESDPGAPVPYDQPRSNEQADEIVGDLNDETMGFVERSRGEFLLRGVRVRRVIADPPEVDRQASMLVSSSSLPVDRQIVPIPLLLRIRCKERYEILRGINGEVASIESNVFSLYRPRLRVRGSGKPCDGKMARVKRGRRP